MPFPKFQNSSRANSANLLKTGQELRTARKDEDSPDLLIAAKVANPSAKPEPTPPEGGEFSNPISRISNGLAESTTGGLSCPGQDKPEEFSRLATLADSRIQQPTLPTRDPDPSGCPTHWQRVPELPPRGSRVVMADGSGFGNLYRFKVEGVWYLLKFLPPFDGGVSITDPGGRVRVLASLEEAASWLAWLAQADEGVVTL